MISSETHDLLLENVDRISIVRWAINAHATAFSGDAALQGCLLGAVQV
jgi:hypothetical protein